MYVEVSGVDGRFYLSLEFRQSSKLAGGNGALRRVENQSGSSKCFRVGGSSRSRSGSAKLLGVVQEGDTARLLRVAGGWEFDN